MFLIDLLRAFLERNSLWLIITGVFLTIIYWIATHPKDARLWAENILRAGSWIEKSAKNLKSCFGRQVDSWRDQGSLNSVSSDLKRQASAEIPKAKIHYLKSCKKSHAISKNGVAHIYVEHTDNDLKNLLEANSTYLQEVWLKKLRSLVSGIIKAFDIIATLRLLKKKRNRALCTLFSTQYVEKELEADPQVQKYLEKLLIMEHNGIFAGITLSELYYDDLYVYDEAILANESEQMRRELLEVLDFFEEISNRSHGERTSLEYLGKYIRVSVLLVGKPSTRLYGISPYVSRVISSLKKGVRNVYVIAVGNDNVTTVEAISRQNLESFGATMRKPPVFYPLAFDRQSVIMSLLATVRLF